MKKAEKNRSSSAIEKELRALCEGGIFSWLDLHFAGFAAEQDGGGGWEIPLTAALVSRHHRLGHICLDISELAGRPLFIEGEETGFECPALEIWRNLLLASETAGPPGDYAPLILDEQNRLYLHRLRLYQELLAKGILDRLDMKTEQTGIRLREGLNRLFPEKEGEPDWQKIAAFAALSRKFCVISGGPGTGKTTTVTKILALALEAAKDSGLRIALAAPTGKAAARLRESILRERDRLDETVAERIPAEASTLHRLLGASPHPGHYRFHSGNPLPVDLMVVDEASMVDLPLMSRLVQALPPRARLILLGDRDQLASVEAGAVLGDICDTGNLYRFSGKFCTDLAEASGISLSPDETPEGPGIRDAVVLLQKSYRFAEDSGIRRVSSAINAGDADAAYDIIRSEEFEDISWKRLPHFRELPAALQAVLLPVFDGYLANPHDPASVFQIFESFRLLCALRKGPFGVESVNRHAERILRRAGVIRTDGRWYPGRPVMITQNYYELGLFNGDIGIALPDGEADGSLRIFFPAEEGRFRKIHPVRLPAHETVFAMTVHKSQGSEFSRLLLLLPEKDSPVLTRELLYTGITRAMNHAEVMGSRSVFKTAVSRPIRRTSGLRDMLWER